MTHYQTLRGVLDFGVALRGTVKSETKLSGVIVRDSDGGIPPYTGAYEVTPKITPQVLETQGKRMEKDVSVNGIPVSVVENQAKGNTVFIG